MHLRTTALLLAAATACTQPQRPDGTLRTIDKLLQAANAGDPDASAVIAPRGKPLRWLSSPFNAGTRSQETTLDGLVVQPAFADANPAAIVTSEIWDGFPRVWAQPVYILVTGFDPQNGPQRLPNALP